MKHILLCVSVLTFLFASCSREKECLKGQVIAIDPCGSFVAVQILEGPAIGDRYEGYDNVIELYGVPTERRRFRTVFYFTHRRTRSEDYRPCPAVYPVIHYSDVERAVVEIGDVACP